MIRSAVLADGKQILDLLLPYTEHYPLTPDTPKIRQTLATAISSAQHYAYVSERDGVIEAVLIGLSSDNLWARKRNCNIVAWVSKAPGKGAELLRNFRDWVRTRPAIRVAGACPDIDLDSRVWDLAERIGFKRQGGAYLMFAG